MKNKKGSVTTKYLSFIYRLFSFGIKDKNFIILIIALTIVCLLAYPYPNIAMWVGFMLAGYAAIANDSIQTIGTFIASNSHRKWYYLWLFMGLIFLITVTVSWLQFDGDVSYQRLLSKGFKESPKSFTFLQLAAPLILLILTRMRMPVSTTFLILNVFTTEASAIIGVLGKSLSGYFIAFGAAIVVWFGISYFSKRLFKNPPGKYWVVIQWVTSGMLWSVWVMQDAANIAIFLPRSLSIWEFIGFAGYIFLGLGILFYLKGDRIQSIVKEKSNVTDVRNATIIDFVYSMLLYYKLFESTTPMSTTWLFIGLLGGRELAVSITKKNYHKRLKSSKKAMLMIGRDMLYALIGLLVSMLLALSINSEIREELYKALF